MNIIYRILSKNYQNSESNHVSESKKYSRFKKFQKSFKIYSQFRLFVKYYFYPDNNSFSNFIYLFDRNKSYQEKNTMTKSISKLSNTSSEISSIDNIDELKEQLKKIETTDEEIEYNFKLRNTDCPDIYQLFTKYQEKVILYGYAHIPSIKCSKYIQKLSNNDYQDIIINCRYSNNFKNGNLNLRGVKEMKKIF